MRGAWAQHARVSCSLLPFRNAPTQSLLYVVGNPTADQAQADAVDLYTFLTGGGEGYLAMTIVRPP